MIRRLIRHLTYSASTGAAILLIGGAVPSMAQQPVELIQTTQSSVTLDDQTLHSFAAATLDVETVIDKWNPRIRSAENETAAQELRTAANQEIIQTVESNGLTMESYNEIFQAVQTNPEIATKVQRFRQEAQ